MSLYSRMCNTWNKQRLLECVINFPVCVCVCGSKNIDARVRCEEHKDVYEEDFKRTQIHQQQIFFVKRYQHVDGRFLMCDYSHKQSARKFLKYSYADKR